MKVEDIQRFCGRLDQILRQVNCIQRLLGQQSPRCSASKQGACRKELQELPTCESFQFILLQAVDWRPGRYDPSVGIASLLAGQGDSSATAAFGWEAGIIGAGSRMPWSERQLVPIAVVRLVGDQGN